MNRSWTEGLPAALAVAGLVIAGMLALDLNSVVLPPILRVLLSFLGATLAVLAGIAMTAYKHRRGRA